MVQVVRWRGGRESGCERGQVLVQQQQHGSTGRGTDTWKGVYLRSPHLPERSMVCKNAARCGLGMIMVVSDGTAEQDEPSELVLELRLCAYDDFVLLAGKEGPLLPSSESSRPRYQLWSRSCASFGPEDE